MSLLLDALKKAELENEAQSKEENVNDDTADAMGIEPIDSVDANASSLPCAKNDPATQNVDTASQHDQENKLKLQTHVLPNMSFIKDQIEKAESSISTGLTLEPQYSQSEESVGTLTTNEKHPIALAESTPRMLAAQDIKDQSDSTPSFQPYRPKTNFSKPWFIAVSALSLMIIGSTGAYYFFERLNEISRESNLSRATPNTSIQDDIASMDSIRSTSNIKKEPLTSSNPKIDTNSLLQVKTDKVSVLTSATKILQKKRVTKPTQNPIQTTINDIRPRTSIDIIKKNRVNPLQELVQLAYRAYVNHNYTEANRLYRKVLSFKQNNRDALIGLAIIAHRSKQPNTARRYYKMILSLNPKDTQAASGLIGLMQGSNATENESRLKIMLENEPQAAHLHFTLGNQYVKQARWADAQQAFFQAYQAQPENADYAMNLAVSLDHIKQPRAALKYYQLALTLAKGKNVAFNVLDIAARVRTITQDITQ